LGRFSLCFLLLKDWVDRLCADVEASDKRKHREKRPKDHSVEF